MLNSDAECDTKRQVNLKKLVEEIRQNKVISNILFTGGEPTLQPFHLIMKDLGNGYTAEVETNATYIPHEYMENFKEADYAKFQWNVSPKFNHYGGKIYSDTISFWAEKCKNFEHVYFKFVISKHRLNQDLNPVLKLIETHDIPIKNVYFMPEGTGLNSQIQNQWLHEICLKYGISYSPRLQVILFGDRRGV